MPGTNITDEDRKKIDAKFICTHCDLLLRMPMQTNCGHLMCLSCLQTLIGSSNPKCPEDGTELKKEEIFHDTYTKRELKGLQLHCTHPGCSWHGTYEDLEGHSGACEHALINCVHSQCKTILQRSELGKHLEKECEHRNVNCEYCGSDIALVSMKEHVATDCEAAPVKCRHCKTDVLRKDVKEHERLSCDEIPAACEFQAVGCSHNKVLKRKELRKHLNDGLMYHVMLLLRFVLNFFSQLKDYIPRAEFSGMIHILREEVSEVRVGLTEKFVTLIGKITGLERRIEGMESTSGGLGSRIKSEIQALKVRMMELTTDLSNSRERNMNMERELREKTSAIARLRGRLDRVDESIALNTVKLTDLVSATGPPPIVHSHNGILLWKIEGFQRKRQEAINGVKTALYSPHFYSSQFGYKMCAKIYMNGDGFGKGSHLSLFFVVMKDGNDALQTWPFRKKITMMLMDQGNGDHMIDAFHSDPQSSSFQRPTSDMNIASGSPLFMPLDCLDNRGYVKDDVMFIKIIVD